MRCLARSLLRPSRLGALCGSTGWPGTFHLSQRVLGASLVLSSAFASAQTATLTPPPQRISDTAIQRDHQQYEQLQARIQALNDNGRRVGDYQLSKAQCWLDVSLHVYTRNDRTDFPQAALDESTKLVVAMETRAPAGSGETPRLGGPAHLRPDLWERITALKQARGASCAAQQTACAEVELVHAGHELEQLQWRHAKPYVQIAEDLIAEAQVAAERCNAPR